MDDILTVCFNDDPTCRDVANLIVSRRDPDGVVNILNSIDGQNARTLYELLIDTFPGRTSR